jgi:hypothetical protein
METSTWKIIVGAGVILSLFGGMYAIDKNYVRQNYHDVCFAQVKSEMSDMQKQTATQRVYDEVYFWQRMEVELTKHHAAHPEDKAIEKKLEEVIKNKEKAEKKLETIPK